jgi:hypothetical protein
MDTIDSESKHWAFPRVYWIYKHLPKSRQRRFKLRHSANHYSFEHKRYLQLRARRRNRYPDERDRHGANHTRIKRGPGELDGSQSGDIQRGIRHEPVFQGSGGSQLIREWRTPPNVVERDVVLGILDYPVDAVLSNVRCRNFCIIVPANMERLLVPFLVDVLSREIDLSLGLLKSHKDLSYPLEFQVDCASDLYSRHQVRSREQNNATAGPCSG